MGATKGLEILEKLDDACESRRGEVREPDFWRDLDEGGLSVR